MVLGKIRPGSPDVRDELVRVGGGGEDAGVLDLLGDLVDVRRPRDAGVDLGVGDESRSRFERGGGELVVHLAGLKPRVEQQIVDEVLGRTVLGVHDGPPLELPHVGNVPADHDAVPAVGPVDLLKNAGRRPGVLHQLGGEQDHHVQGAPQDLALARCERVTGRHGVVDELQVDLEAVLLEEDALLVGREAVVGRHDGQPADPHVDGELDHLGVLVPLVVARALDRGQLLGRQVFVLGHRGDAGGILGLGPALLLAELIHVHLAGLVLGREQRAPEEVSGACETQDDEQKHDPLAQSRGSDLIRHVRILLALRPSTGAGTLRNRRPVTGSGAPAPSAAVASAQRDRPQRWSPRPGPRRPAS